MLPLQQQRGIHDDDDGAGVVHERAHDGVQDAGHGQRDGDEVEPERESHVQLDGGHHALRDGQQVGQCGDVVAHERDVGGIDGDVAARAAHGDAHRGAFEGGRVVDAVAHHAHGRAFALEALDGGQLVLGEAVGLHLDDAGLGGDVARGLGMVAGEQHRLDAQRADAAHGGFGRGAHGVGQGDESGGLAVEGGEHHRAALLGEREGRRLQRVGSVDAQLGQHLAVAGGDVAAGNRGAHAAAGNHVERRRAGERGCGGGRVRGCGGLRGCGLARRGGRALLPPAHDGFAEGVLAHAFRAGHQGIQLLFVHLRALDRPDGHHFGAAVGERAGLVERHLAHLRQPLERIAFAHEHAELRHVADGRHDGRGRGQHERAGAEHHEDGDGADDLAGDEPRAGRRGQGDDDDPGGPSVGEAHDLGLAGIGRLHELDHAGERAVLAHALGAHVERPELVHRPALHLVARRLVDRQRFAGHHRLVDGGASFQDGAVHRHGFAGQHAQHVSHLHVLGGDDGFHTVAHDARRAGRQMHEPLDAGAGLRHRQVLQQRAQLHDERYLAGGEVLADGHRRDERERYEHVGLDVELRHQPDDGAQDDGRAAQHDGDPGRVEGQRLGREEAESQRDGRHGQQRDVLFRAASIEQFFESFQQGCAHGHRLLHE